MKKQITMALFATALLGMTACQKTNLENSVASPTSKVIKKKRNYDYFYLQQMGQTSNNTDYYYINGVNGYPGSGASATQLQGSNTNIVGIGGVPVTGITGITCVHDGNLVVITSPTSNYPSSVIRIYYNDVSNSVFVCTLSTTDELSDLEYCTANNQFYALNHNSQPGSVPIVRIDINTGAVSNPYSAPNPMISATGDEYRGLAIDNTNYRIYFNQVMAGNEELILLDIANSTTIIFPTNIDANQGSPVNTDEMALFCKNGNETMLSTYEYSFYGTENTFIGAMPTSGLSVVNNFIFKNIIDYAMTP